MDCKRSLKSAQQDKIADAARNFGMGEMSVQQLDTYSWLVPIYIGIFGSVTMQVDAEAGMVASDRTGNQQSQPAEETSVAAMVERAQAKKEKTEAKIATSCAIIALLALLAFVGFVIYMFVSNG